MSYPTIGTVTVYDPRLHDLIPPGAQIEQLATNFDWPEGPTWVDDEAGGYLLFSDSPNNRVMKWTPGDTEAIEYLRPAGFLGDDFPGAEPGANGMALSPTGELYLCQHGERQVARMQASLSTPEPRFETVVGHHRGRSLHSPNDIIFDTRGRLYFTDPPFGLPGGQYDEANKALDYSGVYRYDPQLQELALLTADLDRPNGIALTPDEQYLLLSNGHPDRAVWVRYELLPDGRLGDREVVLDVSHTTPGPRGTLLDGIAMHPSGYWLGAGPGGFRMFHPDDTVLGLLQVHAAVSNATLSSDLRYLYMTADGMLLRIALRH